MNSADPSLLSGKDQSEATILDLYQCGVEGHDPFFASKNQIEELGGLKNMCRMCLDPLAETLNPPAETSPH